MAELKTTTIHGNLIIEDGNAIICDNPKIFSSLEEYEKYMSGDQNSNPDEVDTNKITFGIETGTNGEFYAIINKGLNIKVNNFNITTDDLNLEVNNIVNISKQLKLNNDFIFNDGFTDFIPNNGVGTIGLKRKSNKVSLDINGVPSSDIPDDISKAPYLPITAVSEGSGYKEWLLVDLKDKGGFFNGIRIQSPNQEGLLLIGASENHELKNSTFFDVTVNNNTKDIKLHINNKQFLNALEDKIIMSNNSVFRNFVIGNEVEPLNTIEFNTKLLELKDGNITFNNPPSINGYPIFPKGHDLSGYNPEIIIALTDLMFPEEKPIKYIPGIKLNKVDYEMTDAVWKKFRDVILSNDKNKILFMKPLLDWLMAMYYQATELRYTDPMDFKNEQDLKDWIDGNNGHMVSAEVGGSRAKNPLNSLG